LITADVGNLKGAAFTVVLVFILEGEGIFMIEGLKDIQAPSKYNFPAIVA